MKQASWLLVGGFSVIVLLGLFHTYHQANEIGKLRDKLDRESVTWESEVDAAREQSLEFSEETFRLREQLEKSEAKLTKDPGLNGDSGALHALQKTLAEMANRFESRVATAEAANSARIAAFEKAALLVNEKVQAIEQKLAELAKQPPQAPAEVGELTAGVAALEASMTKVDASIVAIQTGLAAVQAATPTLPPDVAKTLQQLAAEVAALESSIQKNRAEFSSSLEKILRDIVELQESPSRLPRGAVAVSEKIQTRVEMFDTDRRAVILEHGSNIGLRKGHILELTRDGALLAQAKVAIVTEDMAAAQVLSVVKGAQPRKGDEVRVVAISQDAPAKLVGPQLPPAADSEKTPAVPAAVEEIPEAPPAVEKKPAVEGKVPPPPPPAPEK